MICERAKAKADSLSVLENIKICAVYEIYKLVNEQKIINVGDLSEDLVKTVIIVEEINFIYNHNLNMITIKWLCTCYMF